MNKLPTTKGVQIDVQTTSGYRVTDPALITMIVQDLVGDATFDVELEDDGCNGWLATVPAEWYGEASEEGSFLLTHSGGYVFEIPMA